MKNIRFFLSETFQFMKMIFSIYLKRLVFVMYSAKQFHADDFLIFIYLFIYLFIFFFFSEKMSRDLIFHVNHLLGRRVL